MRDDFKAETKETLARRVGMRCSNPQCRKPTTGPRTRPTASINIGVAAHITAAAPGGPRFDNTLTPRARKAIENAIRLCQNCAKLVDNDDRRYTVTTLRRWKTVAEELALQELETGRSRVAITDSVMELITIIEIRAATVLNLMEETTEATMKTFRNETRKEQVSRKQKHRDLDKPASAERHDILPLYAAALHSDYMWSRWKYEDEQQLLSELNSIKDEFVSLHHRHKAELIKGNYVAAHEIIGQIHSLIEKFNRTANPPSPFPRLLMAHYCIIMPSFEGIHRRLVEKHQNYPGAITKELACLLPDSLVTFYLVDGDDTGNTKKAAEWHEQEWRQMFEELKTLQPESEDNDAI